MPRMRMLSAVVVMGASFLVRVSVPVDAFSTQCSVPIGRSSTALRMATGNSLLDKLPKFPFGDDTGGDQGPATVALPSFSGEFKGTPDGLVTRAKIMLVADFGLQDESLLDEDFVWIGPNLGSSVLGKRDYLAAGKFFDLRASFPDLDYRGHDFRIDEDDAWTVRLTARMVGTMRGELRLRNEVLSPNGKRMSCPPEAISMTFDPSTGKLVKLCSGFSMDRLAGNTYGMCGVMAAASVAGSPPSDWEVYPLPAVVKRFFGRPVQQLPDPPSVLAPFPETVMIQLAKGILSSEMATEDPDLLSPSFSYCGQYDGPYNKRDFVDNVAGNLFGGVEPALSFFRVDPYDPYRVWVDVRPGGIAENGVAVESPPQAMSFTFDDDGFCTRITAGAVMDPSIGNTGGLGGAEGVRYAAGQASPGIVSRPLPQIAARLRKLLLSPITKVGVDDYVTESTEDSAFGASSTRPRPASEVAPTPVVKAAPKPASPARNVAASRVAKPPPKQENASTQSSPSSPLFFAASFDKTPKTRIGAEGAPGDKTAAAVKKAKEAALIKKKKAADTAKAEAQRQAQTKQRAADAKASAAQASKKRAAEAAKAKADSERKAKAQQQAKAAAAQKVKAQQSAKATAQPEPPFKGLQISRTISLPRLTDEEKAKKAPKKQEAGGSSNPFGSLFSSGNKNFSSSGKQTTGKKAPRGVPTLARWRQNRDGSVTGNVSGTNQFQDNERITTSEIASGVLESGAVVKTKSGSRYFLQ